MALDKLVDSAQLDTDLTAVAGAIRTKGGTSAQLAFPAGFVDAIAAIRTGGGGLKNDTGTFTLAEDIRVLADNKTGIPHDLGEVPKCVVVWTEDFDAQNPPDVQVNAGYIWLDRIVDMDQVLTSTMSSPNGIYINLSIAANATLIRAAIPTSTAYTIGQGTLPTAAYLYLPDWGANNRFRAGVTYHYFVSEGWWT